MGKKTKIWLITAASLILIGGIIFSGVMTVLKWDFTKLSTSKYQTNDYEINDTFKNILVETDTANIDFLPTSDSKILVSCYEQANGKHEVSVNNETLEIKLKSTKKWYEHIGVNFTSPKITVYIPEGEYGNLLVNNSTGDIQISKEFTFENIDIKGSTSSVINSASVKNNVKIKLSTGDIKTENISAKAMDLSVSTGMVTLHNVKCNGDIKIKVSTGKAYITDTNCKNLISSGDTGDLNLKNVKISEKFNVKRSTGDVKLELCDADEIFIETDTGNVVGSLLSEKVFIATSDTGKISVPKTVTGGRCEITTDTGDIKIEVKN